MATITRRKKLMFRLITVVMALFIAALIAEVVCRTAMPLMTRRVRYMRTRSVPIYDPAMVRYDPVCGFALQPNLNTTFTNEEFTTRLRTNAAGYRDDDRSLAEASVLILGDSFAFGWGVEQEQTCADLLETQTGKTVLNMGVPGYGTLQQMLALRRHVLLADLRGVTAIFLMYPNDLYDDQGYGFGAYPILYEQDEQVRISQPPQWAFVSWLTHCRSASVGTFRRNWHVADYLMAALENLQSPPQIIAPEFIAAPRPSVKDAFVITMRNLKQFADSRDITLCMAYIPPRAYFEGKDDRGQKQFTERIVTDQGVSFIDLTGDLNAADYYALDMHWKPSGHIAAARVFTPLVAATASPSESAP